MTAPQRPTLPILVVEDDDVDREALLRLLGRADIDLTIDTADNGAEALEKLRRSDDLPIVLLDWALPEMSGERFLDELRSDPSLECTEVFIHSGSDHPDQIRAAFDQQVAGYVVKEPAGAPRPRLLEVLTAYAQMASYSSHCDRRGD